VDGVPLRAAAAASWATIAASYGECGPGPRRFTSSHQRSAAAASRRRTGRPCSPAPPPGRVQSVTARRRSTAPP